MRIAFDLDGVLADLHRTFAATALRLFPELDPGIVASPETGASPPSTDDAQAEKEEESPALPLDRHQSAAVWRELCNQTDFWESLEEIEKGSIARISSIADERRWEVLFITSRPLAAGATVQRQ